MRTLFRSVTYTAMHNQASRVCGVVCTHTHTNVHRQLTLPSCARCCLTWPALWVWRIPRTEFPLFIIFILFIMIQPVCFIWGMDTILQQKFMKQECYYSKGLVGNQVEVVIPKQSRSKKVVLLHRIDLLFHD